MPVVLKINLGGKMNVMKKAAIFMVSITLFFMNIEGMKGKYYRSDEDTSRPNTFTYKRMSNRFSRRWSQQIANDDMTIEDYVRVAKTIWDLSDYLVQLGSISSVDCTHPGVIGALAKIRTFFNGTAIASCFDSLTGSDKEASKRHLIDIGSTYLRGKHISLDVKNWREANMFAANNGLRKDDKNLSNKKLYHYAWLTFNKILPVVAKYLQLENRHNYKFIARISELYRQKFMYAMITNVQKLA